MAGDLIIAGFPKCGTTNLLAALRTSEAVKAFALNGHIEANIANRNVETYLRARDPARLNVHKFTAYVFKPANAAFLKRKIPGARFVIMVRPPLEVLFSWRAMHLRIAREQRPAEHFAAKNRDILLSGSVDDYQRILLGDRLMQSGYIDRFCAELDADEVLFVRQGTLAEDPEAVFAEIDRFVGRGLGLRQNRPRDAFVGARREGIEDLPAAKVALLEAEWEKVEARIARGRNV